MDGKSFSLSIPGRKNPASITHMHLSGLLAGQVFSSRQVSPGTVRLEKHQSPAHGACGSRQWETPVEELYVSLNEQGYK